jgi:DNA polymerase
MPCFDGDGNPKMISGYGYTSRKIVNDYREGNPKIVGLWKQLDTGFKESVGGDFEMTLPSGRVMRYQQVKREARSVPRKDGKPGFERKIVYTAMIGDRRFPLYGGLLTENLVQATARDVFATQLLTLDSTPGLSVLFTVHDEAINEADLDMTVKDVEGIMSQTPPWLEGCPISAEGCEAAHYKK